MSADTLYSTPKPAKAFQFDQEVVNVFPDMIKRSAPGYGLMLEMLGVISAKNLTQDNSLCYDLGCSLGASTLAIANYMASNSRIIAVDNSPAMLAQCQRNLNTTQYHCVIDLQCADITELDFSPCQMVSLNLTLQFIAPEKRLALLQKINHALSDGGVLFLSEKIRFDDEQEQAQLTALHHQFKKHQGYSDLEIAQKRDAIENVLIPETLNIHKNRLLAAGFKQVILALQCYNFIALIAYK